MDFFADEDVQDLAQLHIEKIRGLEDSEAKRLIRRYRDVRQDLRDRLDTLKGDTFSAQHLRGVLVQVDGAIAAMGDGLKDGMNESADKAATTGLDHLMEELNKYNKRFTGAVVPINVDAVAIATDTKNFLFNQYDVSIDSYSELIRQRLAQGITQAAIEEISLSELTRRLGQFLQGEEWRLEMIARTELHNVYNLGKLNGMRGIAESDIPDLKKTLIHPIDKRTGRDSIYAKNLDLVVPINEPFEYTWKGQVRRYMVPPDRPNDRSILIPYREAWIS